MIERVLIVDEFQTMGHRVIVAGRPHPGAPTHYLLGNGTWEPVQESAYPIDPNHSTVGFRLPEGALDAICREYQKVSAPQPATERHLADALAMRDRMVRLVEGFATSAMDEHSAAWIEGTTASERKRGSDE